MFAYLYQQIEQRIVHENIERILACLALLDEDQIHQKINDQTLSVAQSVVHLNGNCRQWLFSALLGDTDHRQRELEFMEQNMSIADCQFMLRALAHDIKSREIDFKALRFIDPLYVQGIKENSYSAIIHVIEHFSYHVGQIALLTKIWTQKNLGFYDNYPGLNENN